MAVMTSDGDTVALLERALDQTAGLIAAIEPGQAGLATPCAGWDVRALVSHVTGRDLRNFLVAVRGERPDWSAPDEEIGDDWAAAFADRAAPVRAAWRTADLDRSVAGPGGEAPLRVRADQQIQGGGRTALSNGRHGRSLSIVVAIPGWGTRLTVWVGSGPVSRTFTTSGGPASGTARTSEATVT